VSLRDCPTRMLVLLLEVGLSSILDKPVQSFSKWY